MPTFRTQIFTSYFARGLTTNKRRAYSGHPSMDTRTHETVRCQPRDLTSDATLAISEVASLELSPRPTTTTFLPSKALLPRIEQVWDTLPLSGPSCSPEHVWLRPVATTRKSNVFFDPRPSGPMEVTTYSGCRCRRWMETKLGPTKDLRRERSPCQQM